MRKLITLPFNIICFILAILGVILVRSKEMSIGLERRLDVFEEGRKKKKRR